MSLTQSQIEERKLGIGGSDAGIVCGFHSSKTPLELYYQKLGLHNFKFTDEVLEAMEWGNLIEPLVMEQYGKKNGLKLKKPETSLVHREYTWMRANVDFICEDKPIIGEIKTAFFMGNDWGEDGTDSVPLGYLAQMAHNRIVAESHYGIPIEEVHMPVFNTNRIRKTFIYRKNEANEANLIELERIFWKEHIEKEIPVNPVTFHDVKLRYPVSNESISYVDDYHMELVKELQIMKSQTKGITSREEEIKTILGNYMGSSSYLSDENGSVLVSFKTQEKKIFNQKKFREDNPDLYRHYQMTVDSRVFRLITKNGVF